MKKKIEVVGSEVEFYGDSEVSIIEAAEQSGWDLPYSCRKGICSSCIGDISSGVVKLRNNNKIIEAPADKVKFCVATPLSDLMINPTKIQKRKIAKRYRGVGWVYSKNQVTEDVWFLKIRLPNGIRKKIFAGQYIKISTPDSASRSYSIANAPGVVDEVTLHIRQLPGGKFSDRMLSELNRGSKLEIELPFGTANFDDYPQKLIMIGTGTGYAPIKSILLDLASRDKHPDSVFFYWGVRREEHHYDISFLKEYENDHPWFHFIPVVSQPVGGEVVYKGRVLEYARGEIKRSDNAIVYAAGNPSMVDDVRSLCLVQLERADRYFMADAFIDDSSSHS